MKRRLFLQSLSATSLMGSLGAFPASAFASPAPIAAQMAQSSTYTPFMQANALAILRTNGALSQAEFLAKTGLNSAQAEAMLARFAKSGWITPNLIHSEMIEAIRPEWMDRVAKAAAQNLQKAAAQYKNNHTKWNWIDKEFDDETPKFAEISRCCEPDPAYSETHYGAEREHRHGNHL